MASHTDNRRTTMDRKSNRRGEKPRGGSTSTPRHKPDSRIDFAHAAWADRRFDEAIRLYEQAMARDPNNPVLMVDVARAYALRYRYDEAEELVDRASALHHQDSHFQCMLARSYEQMQHFDRAIHCYDQAIKLAPDSADKPGTLLAMAKIHERLHNLDNARDLAEQVIVTWPKFDEAHYVLGTIERRCGDIVSAQKRFEMLTQNAGVSPGIRSRAWYALAAQYDKMGEYALAFAALINAKKILDRAARKQRADAKSVTERFNQMINIITDDHFTRWMNSAGEMKALPSDFALLTGHPRSGTTLLEQILDAHDGLISADELQIMAESVHVPLASHYPHLPIPAMLNKVSLEQINAARGEYWRQVEGALRHSVNDRVLLDKNPELSSMLPVICRVFPEIKIIFAIRDPRDVVLSCFFQDLPLNAVSVQYLSVTGTANKYAQTMRGWLKMREMISSSWITARYEDTVIDTKSQAQSVLAFLGLNWDEKVLKYDSHASQKHVHSPTYEAVTKPVYSSSIGRWKHYEKYFGEAFETLEPFVKAFDYE